MSYQPNGGFEPPHYPPTQPLYPQQQVPAKWPAGGASGQPYNAPAQDLHLQSPLPKRNIKKVLIPVVGGLVALVCVSGVVAAVANNDEPSASQQAQVPVKPGGTPMTIPPTTEATDPPEPEPVVTATKRKPVSYEQLSKRQWLKIAKNPDSHIGEAIVVYGSVTQFDTATGVDTFRADVGASNREYSFDYPTNTILSGDEDELSDLVEDDEFRAKVTVTGSLTYDTQIGGETTVPQLQVESIKVL